MTPALFIQTKSENSYSGGFDFTIDAAFCCVPDNGESYPRGCSDSPLDKLHIIIRGGTFKWEMSEGKTCWHESADLNFCDVYFAKLNEMEEMTKALKSVHRKLDKLTERFGYAATPFDALARVADVLNVDTFYFRNEREEAIAMGQKFRARNRADGLSQVRFEAHKLEQTLGTFIPRAVQAA